MKSRMKDVIADAFFALAQKKQLDKITVKDLVDACGISRQTFYYHFQDILEVIEWQAERMEAELAEQIRQAASLEDTARILAAFFAAHHGLLEKLRESRKRDFAERLVLKAMQEQLRQALRRSAALRANSAAETETLVCFFSHGLSGLLLAQLQGQSPDVDQLTQQILIVFRRLFPDIGQDA